jgi:hypothetical protein
MTMNLTLPFSKVMLRAMNAFSSALSIVLVFLFTSQIGQADILISPQRVILDDANRQAVISLHNPGKQNRSYRLSWVERKMGEDGQLIQLKEGENPQSISSMVRYSPRRVEVEAGKTQTVRLDYRPPSNLAPGEYRSHLRIGLEPPATGLGGTEVMSGKQEGMSFQLNALLSFSVPIFARHGSGGVNVQITSIEPIQVKRDRDIEPALKVTLARSGEFSAYGKLVVYQQMNANDPVDLIGEAGGVALYSEVKGQTREVHLRPGTKLQPGSWLRISYEGDGPDRGKIFAERTLQIGK